MSPRSPHRISRDRDKKAATPAAQLESDRNLLPRQQRKRSSVASLVNQGSTYVDNHRHYSRKPKYMTNVSKEEITIISIYHSITLSLYLSIYLSSMYRYREKRRHTWQRPPSVDTTFLSLSLLSRHGGFHLSMLYIPTKSYLHRRHQA
jgi:hypothetical protein